ncbi:MAG: alkaline phosphatase D family protein [Acidobacteriota bacterium]
MKKILFIIFIIASVLPPSYAQKQKTDQPVSRMVIGSCVQQGKAQPIWEKMVEQKPQLSLLIGDNIYGDTEDMNVLKQKYEMLAGEKGFQKFKKTAPILATWDDHDYGLNDGGANYPARVESQKVFLDFWGEPKDSPRRGREGVYDAKVFGTEGKRVQIILLDTRYFRSPLKRCTSCAPNQGRYEPDNDSTKTMLGDAQWKWLEEQLRVPAEVRIIASSIQLIAEDHGWEKWGNLPLERQRFFNLVRDTKASGVIVISGDRHLAELSMIDAGVGYPIYDLTASGLNNASPNWRKYETNRHRIGTMNWGNNFGMIAIDWSKPDPVIALRILDEDGDINIQRKIRLSTLQPGMIK